MVDSTTKTTLPRTDIAQFIPTPRGQKAFEDLQKDSINMTDAITGAGFLTLEDEPSLGSERVLALGGGLTGVDGGPNGNYTLSLSNTAVTPGSYGSPSRVPSFTVDIKGRIQAAGDSLLVTSNVAEGTNLYFTVARAQAASSAGSGISYVGGVIAVLPAGAYGAPTGTVSRTSFSTYSAPTISNPPTQAEVQAIANAVQAVSRTLAALIIDMKANGNLT